MTGRFTDELWQGSADIYDAILAHPFLAGLTDGSLPQDAFVFYVVQDALYLHGYAQALAAVGSRAPDAAGIEMFSRDAADIVAVERTLHDSLLADLGLPQGRLAGVARRRCGCLPRRAGLPRRSFGAKVDSARKVCLVPRKPVCDRGNVCRVTARGIVRG
jgi:TENA/THI-4/PQQC family